MLDVHPMRRTALLVRAGDAARHGVGEMPLLQGFGVSHVLVAPFQPKALLAVLPVSAAL